ncbi:MAG TPA: hypothetical protein VIV40_13400 [Kofleriaceae bacterium]
MLSNCLLATALIGTPLVAAADPAPVSTQSTPAQPKAASAPDAEHYAALEKQTPAAATFEGGGEGIYIGTGVLTVVLIVLLIVIIL